MARASGSTRCGVIALLLATTAAPVHAALDEALPEAAPESSALRIAGQRLTVRRRGDVREYAASGRIFAVKWDGPFAPNLRALLGPYLAEYEQALRTHRRGGHAHLSLRTPSLEVNAFSHARRVQGAAWVVARLPKGVTIDALP